MNYPIIYKDSMKSYIDDFIYIMDKMLESYRGDEWIVFKMIELNESDYSKMKFEPRHMRNALAFYFEQTRDCHE